MSTEKFITWNIDGKESAPMFFSNPVEDLKAIAQVEALSEIQREVLKAVADLLDWYSRELPSTQRRLSDARDELEQVRAEPADANQMLALANQVCREINEAPVVAYHIKWGDNRITTCVPGSIVHTAAEQTEGATITALVAKAAS